MFILIIYLLYYDIFDERMTKLPYCNIYVWLLYIPLYYTLKYRIIHQGIHIVREPMFFISSKSINNNYTIVIILNRYARVFNSVMYTYHKRDIGEKVRFNIFLQTNEHGNPFWASVSYFC